MNNVSLAHGFFTPTTEPGLPRNPLRRNVSGADMRRLATEVPFNAAFDQLRRSAAERIDRGEGAQLAAIIDEAGEALTRSGVDETQALMIYAALRQTATAVNIVVGNHAEAKVQAAATLNLLAQDPKRKDEPFMAVFAALLYDMAALHAALHEYRQAEREIEKSLKIFERLARLDAERYGPALILSQNAVTTVVSNRRHQAELLAQYQAATTDYLRMVNEGIGDASSRLVESLNTEGLTLVRMGRHREAIQYFSRALKYLTRLEPVFDRRQLEMSIDLGEALLNVAATREKGIHLLNTMLHKATKLNADDLHRRIVDILLNAKSRRLDIIAIWHKVFPR